MIIETAEGMLEDNAGIETEDIYGELKERAFSNLDHEWLYAAPGDVENEASLRNWLSIHGLDVEKWFDKGAGTVVHPHPFLLDG
ncbi:MULTISPECIES: hypothetical protein [Glycomyces]|uniref:Uncharacterized protein n=2 Tax=Glycomyces TaxID=58113 RepID=A0A9X3SWT3_9ACTN|nr:hypothetical protein [Glycomyces lechevalierae]MDA1384346.1 hypothetical protein [Glycomyces lechevalierae]MDR7339221.1 hypothetical protein [Glycomyces lechevalierae]